MSTSSSIYAIPLPRERHLADFPTNRVFLISGEKKILVDTGHPSQWDNLVQTLKGLDIRVEDISEIYYTSQSSDSVGNRRRFPNATHFSASKMGSNQATDRLLDSISPHLESEVFNRLKNLVRVEHDPTEVTLIADGDSVYFNEIPFDVVTTGSRTLFLSEQLSFVGEVRMGDLPPFMPDSDDLQRIVSRAQNLAEGVVYSTFRDPYEDSTWFFKQTQRAFQAFQQSAKLDVPLQEFCKRDLGGIPDDRMFWGIYLLKYAPFFLPQQNGQ